MIHRAKRLCFPWKGVFGAVLVGAMTLLVPAQNSSARHGHGLEGVVDGRHPNDFEGLGSIDYISEDRIVINDTQHRLSPNVKYYRKGRKRANRSLFQVGARVGYTTDSKGQIRSLWLIRPSRTGRKP